MHSMVLGLKFMACQKLTYLIKIDKRQLRFMGDGAAFNYIAMEQAIKDSGLTELEVSNERTGLIVGSGGPHKNLFGCAHQIVLEKKSPKRMGPFMVTRGMSSTNSACLATPFKIKGVNYSISSALLYISFTVLEMG